MSKMLTKEKLKIVISIFSIFSFLATPGGILAVEERFTESVTSDVEIGDAPVQNPMGWPVSGFISQLPNIDAPSHAGLEAIDIAGNDGFTVCTTHDGTASTFSEGIAGIYGTTGLGNYVAIVSTDGNFTSFYGHLRNFLITDGPVRTGEPIGIVGDTGRSDGAHLHYEFHGLAMAPPNIPATPELNLIVSGC